MAAKAQALKYKRVVNAPASEVYRAFTNATSLREWFCNAAQADAIQGGRLYLWWPSGYYAAGAFTGLTHAKKVAFSWQGRGEPEATQVQVSLAAKADGRTAIGVTHAGIGSGPRWAKARENLDRVWTSGLENLQSVLETGLDMRLSLRPMLGINVGEFNAEVASKLGVPVAEGLRLDATLEGMGAHAAGLQKDDVLIQLGGKKLTGFSSLIAALDGRRAGDQVRVVFYRGPEKKTVTMELSRRPLPDLPPTADGLANALRKIHDEIGADLEKCFEDVTEEEASYRPAPGEWSAKETVAHLIAGERDWHFWIAGLATDEEPDTSPGNLSARTISLVKVHPTIPELLAELKESMAESVALVAALPPEFEVRKGSYWLLGYNLLQPKSHAHDHYKQIQAAIAAARSHNGR